MLGKFSNSTLNFGLILGFCLCISCGKQSTAISQTESNVHPTPSLISANIIANTDKRKLYSASVTCQKIRNNEERSLCNRVVKDQDLGDVGLESEFIYVNRRLDLNNDGFKDAIVWIPNMCGSSGCPIAIYYKLHKGFGRLWNDQAWTPIILLNSRKNGWQDVAFQVAGGGIEAHYVVLQYDGKSYKSGKTQKEQPIGEVIIDKDWQQSVFGPIPNQ